MERREDARRQLATELTSETVPIACCESLADFGREFGWRVQPVPSEVLTLAAETLVGMENQEALGMLAFNPAADALLRASTMFLRAVPWQVLSMKTPLLLTFSGDSVPRVVAVGGASVMPPSVLILPSQAAWQRLNEDPDARLEDAIIAGFDDLPGVVGETLQLAYGLAFHPMVLRLRRGSPRPFVKRELLELAGALAAVASLATGRPVGRAVVDGLETIVMPLTPETTLRS